MAREGVLIRGEFMRPFPWRCPFCDRDTTIVEEKFQEREIFSLKSGEGYHCFVCTIIVCPNDECKKLTFEVKMYSASYGSAGYFRMGHSLKSWQLIPPSKAKVFPGYVPKAIREDYEEACLIENLSPKSSATLARRCLQGMIWDFWKVRKNRLIDEIEAIKDKVDPLTWEAIDAVRKLGNIGAHMEKDIDLIVDVEPEEASKLIWLIELLIRDWYIDRHERKESLKAIVAVGEAKEQAKGEPVVGEEPPDAVEGKGRNEKEIP